MKPILLRIYSTDTRYLLILSLLIIGLSFYLSNHFLHLNDLLLHQLYDQIGSVDNVRSPGDQGITQYLSSYLISIVFYLVKYFSVALTIIMGLTLLNKKDINLSIGNAFKIALVADAVFFIPIFFKIFWFLTKTPGYNFSDFQLYYPLSALNLLDIRLSQKSAWIYPLQTINLFEIGYWFLLALGVKKYTKLDFDSSLKVILFGYLPALIIWMLFIGFLFVVVNPAS